MNCSQTCVHQIMNLAAEAGITVSEVEARQLLRHLELVLEKNRQVNLTSIESIDEGITLHIVDSLLFLPHVSGRENYLDIGTGGGYPGIPLAICSGARGLLVDSVGKKAAAVSDFIEELGLARSCSCQAIRAEELALEQPGSFSCVVARAVAPMDVLIEYAAPLLENGGLLVISKARPEEEELEGARRASELCGMSIVSRETIELPNGKGTRKIIVVEKTGEPKVKLPRRPGMARKRPLGSK